MFEKLKYLFTEITSALLIFLFVYTAINKLINHNEFIFSLTQSPLLRKLSILISWLVPGVELIISLLLIVPEWRRWGLMLSVLLMAAFTLYVGYMLLFIPDLSCSCGGIIQQFSWHDHLLFNMLFTILAYAGFIFFNHKAFIAINRLEAENPVKKK